MKEPGMKQALESIARAGVAGNLDLWPAIQARLNERRSFVRTLRAQPMLAILLVLLIVLVLTGAAYAIGILSGYLPGVGFVQRNSLRVLAEPVNQTRQGITVTIEQVTVDSQRTVIIYKTEGMSIQAANSKGEGGGSSGFESPHLLRLPDGSTLNEMPFMGYGGTPEPIINNMQTEGGWPNYVSRLVYPSVPPQVNELTLVIPVLQTMPAGAAPEKWEITFHLKSAPPELTFAPYTELAPGPSVQSPQTSEAANTTPTLSNAASLNGFTFSLDNVIELDDGFVLTGNLSWDDSIFPTGKGRIEEVIPALTDENGQKIPIEPVQLNATYNEHHAPWSYRTNRKAFAGALTLSIPSITTILTSPPVDFEVNFGPTPQIGQSWDINRDFLIEGHTVRLLSLALRSATDTCTKAMLEFQFKGDVPGMGAMVSDAVPGSLAPGQICEGGGGGGGGTADPAVFYSAVPYYDDVPTSLHHYSISASIPYAITGPWQVSWQPPMPSAVTVTAEREACLTLETWRQVTERDDPLPAGLEGKLLTTVDEGGLLPVLYMEALDGTSQGKFDVGSWPSLSPDGTRLVYGYADAVHILDLLSGQHTSFTNDGYAHHWSPDNTRLLYTTTFGLYVINADGSHQQKIDTGSVQVISVVGWLPDNQTIVYAAMGGAGFTFTTYNLQNAETKALFTIQNKAGYGSLSPDGQWIVFADRVFGADNWGIFISHLDGSDRRPVAAPDVPTAFISVWGPDGKWLILSTRVADGKDLSVLVNPFTCEAVRLSNVHGMVEGWSP